MVRVVGVAELALGQPYLTSADEIMAQGNVHQQIGLLRHADIADFDIGAAVALTREHPLPLVIGDETGVVTNALPRPQDTVVRAGPIRSMMEAGVDVVPGTFTTQVPLFEVPLAAAWHIRERSEGRVVGEAEELMEEGNIVLLCDTIVSVVRGALRPSSSMRGPSGPTLTQKGRKRDVAACRPPRRCVAAYCHAVQSAHQAVFKNRQHH